MSLIKELNDMITEKKEVVSHDTRAKVYHADYEKAKKRKKVKK